MVGSNTKGLVILASDCSPVNPVLLPVCRLWLEDVPQAAFGKGL
jgi:hypothetical protein